MTIRRDLDQSPGPDDDLPQANAGRRQRGSEQQNEIAGPDRRAADERHALLTIAEQVLATPGALVQALVFVGILAALVLAAAGLLGVKVDVGPVHVGPAAIAGRV